MSYQNKVALWRPLHRAIEERRKRRATAAGAAGAVARTKLGMWDPKPLAPGETSLLRQWWDRYTGWRSKRALAKAAAEEAKQKRLAAEKLGEIAGTKEESKA